jgi:5-methyltetrahydropteroyltriglutamate--homocysteine methyltransferase
MGSLPRPDVLADLLVAQADGKPVDAARIPALTDEAMDYIVRRQLEAGIDVGNDGEMPRSTFFGYIIGRMSGFGGRSNRRPILDMQHFPKWWQNFQARGTRRLNVYGFPAAIGPVRYESLDGGPNSARAELDAFARALKRQTQPFAETFVTAVSPGFAACSLENQHYDSHEAYVFASPASSSRNTSSSWLRATCCRSTRPTSASSAPATSRTSRCRSSSQPWRCTSRR